MTIKKSMVESAYEILSSKKRAMQFLKLWQEVSKETGADNNLVSQFYSDLSLDGRFAHLKDNKWDLSSRRKFDEAHIDVKKIELDDDDDNFVTDEDGNIDNYSDED